MIGPGVVLADLALDAELLELLLDPLLFVEKLRLVDLLGRLPGSRRVNGGYW